MVIFVLQSESDMFGPNVMESDYSDLSPGAAGDGHLSPGHAATARGTGTGRKRGRPKGSGTGRGRASKASSPSASPKPVNNKFSVSKSSLQSFQLSCYFVFV